MWGELLSLFLVWVMANGTFDLSLVDIICNISFLLREEGIVIVCTEGKRCILSGFRDVSTAGFRYFREVAVKLHT